MDLPAEEQPTLDSGVKLEEPEVHVQTQSTGSRSQRQLGGHDPSVIGLEDEP